MLSNPTLFKFSLNLTPRNSAKILDQEINIVNDGCYTPSSSHGYSVPIYCMKFFESISTIPFEFHPFSIASFTSTGLMRSTHTITHVYCLLLQIDPHIPCYYANPACIHIHVMHCYIITYRKMLTLKKVIISYYFFETCLVV